MRRPACARRAGFTLIELSISVAILSLLIANVGMVTRTGSRAARAGLFEQLIEDELEQGLNRARLALMSSTANNLYPTFTAPLSNDEITYSMSLGYENNAFVESDPERISWEAGPNGNGRMVWSQNPGEPNERRVVWSNSVPVLQEGEIDNETDDNDNGLDDETGIAIHVESESDEEVQVYVHLTIEKIDQDGNRVPASRMVNVTCRN